MGHMRYEVLVNGSFEHPQPSLLQSDSFEAVKQVDRYLYHLASDLYEPLVDKKLVLELQQAGVRFDRKSLIMTVKDNNGKNIWLEKGTPSGGYEHMRERGHLREIEEAFGISEKNIPNFIRSVIRTASIVDETVKSNGKHQQITRVYQYKNQGQLLVALGDNGFIVSVFPYNHSKKR